MFASAMWPIANRKISVEIIHLTFLRQERKNNLNAIWMYLNRRPLVSSGIYCLKIRITFVQVSAHSLLLS